MTRQVKRSAYDALYENDWNKCRVVALYNDESPTEPATSFEGIMMFAHFMSRQLGFRLRVTFKCGGRWVYFQKVS